MARKIRWLFSLAAIIAALFGADAARCQNFSISVDGGLFPIIHGATNLADGTYLFINVKKPWLPDGAQRIAQGLAACGEDCFPATTGQNNLTGTTVMVSNGNFVAGPFSFFGQPFQPGNYPLEISLSVGPKTTTPDEIRAMGTVLYDTMINVAP